MKASEITVGQVYLAKVSGKVVPVRVLWRCRNELTGREITVRSCQRFRVPVAEASEVQP